MPHEGYPEESRLAVLLRADHGHGKTIERPAMSLSAGTRSTPARVAGPVPAACYMAGSLRPQVMLFTAARFRSVVDPAEIAFTLRGRPASWPMGPA